MRLNTVDELLLVQHEKFSFSSLTQNTFTSQIHEFEPPFRNESDVISRDNMDRHFKTASYLATAVNVTGRQSVTRTINNPLPILGCVLFVSFD